MESDGADSAALAGATREYDRRHRPLGNRVGLIAATASCLVSFPDRRRMISATPTDTRMPFQRARRTLSMAAWRPADLYWREESRLGRRADLLTTVLDSSLLWSAYGQPNDWRETLANTLERWADTAQDQDAKKSLS